VQINKIGNLNHKNNQCKQSIGRHVDLSATQGMYNQKQAVLSLNRIRDGPQQHSQLNQLDNQNMSHLLISMAGSNKERKE